jgi:transcription elongation GreA/GreB family factor
MTKTELIAACEQLLDQRLQRIDAAMSLSREAAEGETKSSAGDKFETTRAMMHAELERLSAQRNDVLLLKKGLYTAAQAVFGNVIVFGSVVKTNVATYFLAAAIGKITLGQQEVFVLSTASPLGQLLLGKSAGEEITLGKVTQKVLEVY